MAFSVFTRAIFKRYTNAYIPIVVNGKTLHDDTYQLAEAFREAAKQLANAPDPAGQLLIMADELDPPSEGIKQAREYFRSLAAGGKP